MGEFGLGEFRFIGYVGLELFRLCEFGLDYQIFGEVI